MSAWINDRAQRRGALALGLALSVYALVLVAHRADQGRQALLRWKPDFARLDAGESIYHRLDPARSDVEGFPTPPVSALALRTLLVLGDTPACVALALAKLACAWLIALVALRCAFGRARDAPPLALLVVLLGCARIDLSELAHGNVNLLVGGCAAASLAAAVRGRDARAGAWAALGAALKLTPALFAVYFAWQRRWRALAGFTCAYAFASWLVPGLVLGFARALELYTDWLDQMVGPRLDGAPLALTQTEQINQSLTGVLARWCSDAVAIAARPPVHARDVRIAAVELSPNALSSLIACASLLVVGVLLWATRPRKAARDHAVVAHAAPDSRLDSERDSELDSARTSTWEFRPGHARDARHELSAYALVALAMLLVSERSWKQHYVLLPLAHVALLAIALEPSSSRAWRRCAWTALGLSLALHAASADALLGARASDYAEAAGAFALGALALFGVLAAHAARVERASRASSR